MAHAVLLMIPANATAQETGIAPPAISRLPAGIPVADREAPRFNRVLHVGTPRLTSGATDSVSKSISRSISSFSLTLMATVTRREDGYQLDEIGIGHAYPVAGMPTIVRSDSLDQLGISLGFIEKQVLSQNEKNYTVPRVLVRTSTLILFEVDGLVHLNAAHLKRDFRHLVWIHPETGRLAMAVWLMRPETQADPTVEDTLPVRLVAADTREQRGVHVDGNEFVLSIPNERAFALEGLPKGLDLAWTPALRIALGEPRYGQNELNAMLSAINDAIAVGR